MNRTRSITDSGESPHSASGMATAQRASCRRISVRISEMGVLLIAYLLFPPRLASAGSSNDVSPSRHAKPWIISAPSVNSQPQVPRTANFPPAPGSSCGRRRCGPRGSPRPPAGRHRSARRRLGQVPHEPQQSRCREGEVLHSRVLAHRSFLTMVPSRSSFRGKSISNSSPARMGLIRYSITRSCRGSRV